MDQLTGATASRRQVLALAGIGAIAGVLFAWEPVAEAHAVGDSPESDFSKERLVALCVSSALGLSADHSSGFRVSEASVQRCAKPSLWLVTVVGTDSDSAQPQGLMSLIGGTPKSPEIVLTWSGAPLLDSELNRILSASGDGGA